MTVKPNFLIIGAMKSGTTSLHNYLVAHPDVFMSTPKEPCGFVDPEQLTSVWPSMAERGYCKSEENYLDLFKDAGQYRIRGESSTLYTKLPQLTGCAERIRAFDPKMRLLYIMRDPVERTISHYWHEFKNLEEEREILDAIQSDSVYRDVSHYSLQLKHFFEYFPREQIFTLTFEEMKQDLDGVLRRIFCWLEIDPDLVSVDGSKKFHQTKDVIATPKGFGLLYKFRYSGLWNALGGYCPPAIRRLGRKLSDKNVDRKQVDLAPVKEYLRPIQREQTKALAGLLGREFPEWKTLYSQK